MLVCQVVDTTHVLKPQPISLMNISIQNMRVNASLMRSSTNAYWDI